ncbi:hypothetical protein ACQ4PT_049695 [Festuca glaucescens]
MAAPNEKESLVGGGTGQDGRSGDRMEGNPRAPGCRTRVRREDILNRHRNQPIAPAGLLMVPPSSGGEQGDPGEGSTRPKLLGGGRHVELFRRREEPYGDEFEASDGNWDDRRTAEEETGLRAGPETHIGGDVDMEDDVYLELDEEEVPEVAAPRTVWKLLGRYMAQFKPSARDMFVYFDKEVWHLHTGIKYTELQKNYYMLTLFSQGDYEFVKRGGPWIFNKNALIVKEIKEDEQPSEMVLDRVSVWVRIYDVPWGKQKKATGMMYGQLLGRPLEVDEPTEEKDMDEFLRVRIELPYDRRLQTQITVGVKGKPSACKVYKLKYERVPHYCAHCGFMGHRKFECEKKWRGVPSLDYEAYELRCSPYKKFEHRSHFVSAAGHPVARKELSFASFGSVESRNASRRSGLGVPASRVIPRNHASENTTVRDEFEEEKPGLEEVNQSLSAQVGAMQVQPIVQLPEDVGNTDVELRLAVAQVHQQDAAPKRSKKTSARKVVVKSIDMGRMSTSLGTSDMIPALRGLSSMVVSFGDSDEQMPAVDQTPRKRSTVETAEREAAGFAQQAIFSFASSRIADRRKTHRSTNGGGCLQRLEDKVAPARGLPDLRGHRRRRRDLRHAARAQHHHQPRSQGDQGEQGGRDPGQPRRGPALLPPPVQEVHRWQVFGDHAGHQQLLH